MRLPRDPKILPSCHPPVTRSLLVISSPMAVDGDE